MPATPTRMASFAPRTRPDDLVPAIVTVAAAANAWLRKFRRVTCFMERPFHEYQDGLQHTARHAMRARPFLRPYQRFSRIVRQAHGWCQVFQRKKWTAPGGGPRDPTFATGI